MNLLLYNMANVSLKHEIVKKKQFPIFIITKNKSSGIRLVHLHLLNHLQKIKLILNITKPTIKFNQNLYHLSIEDLNQSTAYRQVRIWSWLLVGKYNFKLDLKQLVLTLEWPRVVNIVFIQHHYKVYFCFPLSPLDILMLKSAKLR